MNDRKPNWRKWNLIDDTEVWKVIALSLDIDPDKIKSEHTDWMAGGAYVNHESSEFQDRLDVVGANYKKIDATPQVLSMNGIAYCHMNIPKFAQWAISVNWEMPDELKHRAPSLDEISQEKANQLFDKDSATYPPELDLAMQAWRVAASTEGKGKPKARIRAWLDVNTSLSNEAKERIATVANWDKIGGATRTD